MKKNNSEVINGILMFFALALYFFIEQLFDNQDKSYLRFFNALIVLYFVNRTVKQKIESGNDHFLRNFLFIEGIASAIIVSLVVMQYWKNTQSSGSARSGLSADR